jgi:hypothetical protein
MKSRAAVKYAIKVFEVQWDARLDETVKPFFEQLRRDTSEIETKRAKGRRRRHSHDALFSYKVFQNAEGLRDELNAIDTGIGKRLKVAYFACHGTEKSLCAVQDISRTKLKNIIAGLTTYRGLVFGACDIVTRDTAEQLLEASPHCLWVAGYSAWTPWLEGTLCDLLFFRLLLSGKFRRPHKNVKWDDLQKPDEAARQLYEVFPQALDLRFSLFYRTSAGVKSTLDEYTAQKEATKSAGA